MVLGLKLKIEEAISKGLRRALVSPDLIKFPQHIQPPEGSGGTRGPRRDRRIAPTADPCSPRDQKPI